MATIIKRIRTKALELRVLTRMNTGDHNYDHDEVRGLNQEILNLCNKQIRAERLQAATKEIKEKASGIRRTPRKV